MSSFSQIATTIFQKSLQDLVKGIRNHKRDASSFISEAIAEIKLELRSCDAFVKAQAIRKLTFLQMMGYDISWASFCIVELISMPRFAHKRIGYLAANQSFHEKTDVILLTTNTLKKEFTSAEMYEIGSALNCLSNIVTKDLAKDLLSDVVTLMSNSRPYIRKKAILTMYKLFIKYPSALRMTFDIIKEKLDDPESVVVSCAVNVICELAHHNPTNYLLIAPKLFRLLTSSSNNWMLIKVVKLFGALVAEEPRLARKLLDPLVSIVQGTTAKSLQYECVCTIATALPYTRRDDGTDVKNLASIVQLCSDHLRVFVSDADQNLKYLGLVGLVSLMKSHPRAVIEHRDLILQCLYDDDITIRTRALELLSGMVTRRTLVDLVHKLLQHVSASEGKYREELISKIIFMCSRDKYSFLTDFTWYFAVLKELSKLQSSPENGRLVANQLMDVAIRAPSVRQFAIESMLGFVLDSDLLAHYSCFAKRKGSLSEILMAAAWIVGEYSNELESLRKGKAPAKDSKKRLKYRVEDLLGYSANDDDADDEEDADEEDSGCSLIEGPGGESVKSQYRGVKLYRSVISSLLHPRVTNLEARAQVTYLQAAIKVFIHACKECSDEEELKDVIDIVVSRLSVSLQSVHLEVQERVNNFKYLLSEFGIVNFTNAIEESAPTEERSLESDDAGHSVTAIGDILSGGKNAPTKAAVQATSDLLGLFSSDALFLAPKVSSTVSADSFMASAVAASAKIAAQASDFLIETDSSNASIGVGVSNARAHADILMETLAICFYPVKANVQEKVPLPETINLNAPFNKAAMRDILSVATPKAKDMNAVNFFHGVIEAQQAQAAASSVSSPFSHSGGDVMTPLAQASDTASAEHRQLQPARPGYSSLSTPPQLTDPNARLFMIGSSSSSSKIGSKLSESEIEGLSVIHVNKDDLEDADDSEFAGSMKQPAAKKKKNTNSSKDKAKKGDKTGKGSGGKIAHSDTRPALMNDEVDPSGTSKQDFDYENDDDDDRPKTRRTRESSSKSGESSLRDVIVNDDDDKLEMPMVAAYPTPTRSAKLSSGAAKMKSIESPAADLLQDSSSSSKSPSEPKAGSRQANDLLLDVGGSENIPIRASGISVSQKELKHSSWVHLTETPSPIGSGSVTIKYSPCVSANQSEVAVVGIQVTNDSGSAMQVRSVTIIGVSGVSSISSSQVRSGKLNDLFPENVTIPAGESLYGVFEMSGVTRQLLSSCNGDLLVSLSVSMSSSSSSSSLVECRGCVKLSMVNMMHAMVLTSEQVLQMLSDRAGSFISNEKSIMKTKETFKAIGKLLGAHVVEIEGTEAATLCGRTQDDAVVIVLLKKKKKGQISIEAKATHSGVAERVCGFFEGVFL